MGKQPRQVDGGDHSIPVFAGLRVARCHGGGDDRRPLGSKAARGIANDCIFFWMDMVVFA